MTGMGGGELMDEYVGILTHGTVKTLDGKQLWPPTEHLLRCGHCDDPARDRREAQFGPCGNCNGTRVVPISQADYEWALKTCPERVIR
jgi:hypothetical protein